MMKAKSTYQQIFTNIQKIVISTILLLYVCTCMIFIFYSIAESKKSSDLSLWHIENRLNSYLSSMEHFSKLLVSNKTIQNGMTKYYLADGFEGIKPSMALEIYRIIYPVSYIYSTTIYDKNLDVVVTSENKPMYLDIDITSISGAFWRHTTKYTPEDLTIDVFSYIYPFYHASTGAFAGFVETSISEDSISDIYDIQSSDTDYYILLSQDGDIRSSSKNTHLSKQVLSQITNRILYKQHMPSYYYTNTRYIPVIDSYLVHIIPLSQYIRPSLTISGLFLLVAIACIFISLFISKQIAIRINTPLLKLISHIQEIPLAQLSHIDIATQNSDIAILIDAFNDMVQKQRILQNENMHLEESKHKLQISLLQEQIKPHFLYNTLDNIYSLADLEEKELLLRLVSNLSNFYKNSLHTGEAFISLEKELEITKSYLEIMKIRYFDQFDYEIHIDTPSLLQNTCPKLLLQPLVENSIYHGIKGLSYKGHIEIYVTEHANYIHIEVRDNGHGIQKNPQTSGANFALSHLEELLHAHYGKDGMICIKPRVPIGCIAKIQIRKGEPCI